MASFVAWLQYPLPSNVRSLICEDGRRSPRTVNMVINTVLSFYDYLMRHEDYQQTLSERLKRICLYLEKDLKIFFYHINKDKTFKANILRVNVLKLKLKFYQRKI